MIFLDGLLILLSVLSLFFLSAGCFFLFFFSMRLLFVKTATPFLNTLLFVWIFVRFHQVLCVYLVETGYIIQIPFILRFSFPFYYAAPACGFLYVNALIYNRKKLSSIEYLHFLPAILAMIEIYPWYFSHSLNTDLLVAELVNTKNMAIIDDTGFMPSSFHYWFKNSLLLIYLSLSWRVIFRSDLMKVKGWNDSKKTWIILILTTVTLSHFNLFIRAFNQNGILFIDQYPLAYQFSLGVGIMVLFGLLYFLIINPKLLYGYLIFDKGYHSQFTISTISPLKTRSKLNSSISGKDSGSVLENIILKDKLFLNPKLNLMDLAQASSMSIHRCSRLINTTYGIGAPDWFNKFRIDYFIQTYPGKCNAKTIDAISLESGFSSRATFYRAFKKGKGMMPSEFFKT
ncbi:AraC family transcriptional regulator [Daejeonella sp.]|uniref:helix-turn-helix domain-containing protein n=1 Tax=Daejeonella sp. TaxID=2805397 RepID=UPI0027B9C22C|nr:helix-turn-helix domain-containing protein [Daejeonella sp.]